MSFKDEYEFLYEPVENLDRAIFIVGHIIPVCIYIHMELYRGWLAEKRFRGNCSRLY